MNYYERHIGDYLKDTSHLSLLEHGVYTRLLDVYYTREGPIPAVDAARLIGARTREERSALASVLAEFFQLVGDQHGQDRCDREIARFQDKRGKAKASAEARWGAQRSQSDGNANAHANASADAMRTHSEGNATREHTGTRPPARPQSPVTRPNNQEKGRATASEVARVPDTEGDKPTPAGLACKAMRQAGLQAVNPGDPRLIALLEQGATVEELSGVAAEAVEKAKGFAWVLAVVQSRRTEAAAIVLAPAVSPPSASTVPSDDAERTAEYLRERSRPFTPEERAKADEARKRAMEALGTTRSHA